MPINLPTFVVAVSVAATACVGPALAADARQGEALAKRWCATCHIVASDQTSGNAATPTFASIAKRPGFTPAAVANFLRDPHPKMPDMALSRAETDDIAAYIAILAK
jgi:mono/diheme cytochrome c family protein